jgi:UDP-N-acetyl-D-glucosamine dehydrogenase
MRRQPSRSATSASPPGPEPEGIAYRSIPATCRGRSVGAWANVVSRLSQALNREQRSINGSRILLLGLAYKRNTGDTRESPGMVIAQSLRALGADVRVADPHVMANATDLPLVDLTEDQVKLADAVVVVTDHDDFDYAMVRDAARYVLDTRNRIRGPRVESL